MRYLNTKQGEDYQEYIRCRNAATHAIRKARRNYEKQVAKQCRKNPKGVFKYMKSTQRMASKIPHLRKRNGELTTNDKEIADTLAQQYQSAFTIEDTQNIPEIPQKTVTEKLLTFEIKQELVEKLLHNLIPTKAPGVDKLHPRILKEIADIISYPITEIAKKSLEEGELPRNWLDAIVIPIYKKDDKRDPTGKLNVYHMQNH